MSSNVVALKAVGEPTTIDGVVTTPGWLLSDPEDHVWTVADGPSYDFDQPRTASIDFRHHLPDGTRLTDPSNEEWLALARQYAVLLREHETSRIDTAQMQAAQVRELFKLMDFMRLQAEPIERFEHLRQADIARYVLVARHGLASILDVAERAAGLAQAGVDISDARTVREHLHLPPQLSISAELEVASGRSNGEPNMLTHNPLFRTLLVPEQLWDFRREIEGDNLRFHPFETSASAEAAKHCSDTCRTPVIPQRQAMMLIDGCLRLFVELGPIVLSCRSVMEDEFAKATNRPSRRAALARLAAVQAEGIGKLSERLRLPKGRSPLDVIEQATVVLVQACFVLIAALSARRAAEIETLQEDCITGGDGSRFVYSAILKTERENQHTPVPDVVARLVDWMHEIGTPARLASGSQRLFIWSDARSLATRSRARTNVPKDFDRLAQLCDVPPHEGMAWRFSARQFRRFFAIVYMWRYENPDLGALRLHLRHWDFRQTRGYCTDGTLGRIFTEEQRGFAGGHGDVGGGYAEKESAACKIPLLWMIDHAKRCGLRFNKRSVNSLVLGEYDDSRYVRPDHLGATHETMTAGWSVLEFLPRKLPQDSGRPSVLGIGLPLFERRHIPSGSSIHASVAERREKREYAPSNLPAEIVVVG